MKITDYIVKFLVEKNVTDIFGYPGGVICHLMDSVTKYTEIESHINYNEQASALAACGYAQATNNIGVAFSTSGPGATNLVTGIANAWFDSIPVIFITGQVDTYALKGDLNIRQRGFQETDIVGMTKGITKYAVTIDCPEKIKYYLERAYREAKENRPGPVVLDIPADVQRADVDIDMLEEEGIPQKEVDKNLIKNTLLSELTKSHRPLLLLGQGIKQSGNQEVVEAIIKKWNIPTVTSMPAFDLLDDTNKNKIGFIGVNGHRYANFAIGKSDLIITLGTRLDLKQTGARRGKYALNARLIRVDADENELAYRVREDELQINADIKTVLEVMLSIDFDTDPAWRKTLIEIKDTLYTYDYECSHRMIGKMSDYAKAGWGIAIDVGQMQPHVAQAFKITTKQSAYMSSGLGTMGYSLPAAIGIYYALRKPVISFNGDGGIQMNIQEFQFLKREKLPINIVIMNNHALGMIRQFQEKNFDENYMHTTSASGYTTPDFSKVAYAYDIKFKKIENIQEIKEGIFETTQPCVIEIKLEENTYLNPNQGNTDYIQDQMPLIERDVYEKIMSL